MSPSMATNGKSSELFTNNFDELDNAFFDEFITFSPSNEGLPEPKFSEESDSKDSKDSKDQSSETLLGSLHDDDAQEIENNWQGDPWVFAQDSASPDGTQDNLFYAEISGRAAISDSDLLSLEDISSQSPQIEAWSRASLPTSPAPPASTRRKSRVEALANTLKKVSSKSEKALRSPIRKSSTVPSNMVRGSTSHGKMSRETLRRKLSLDSSKFNFNPQHQSPMSPPQSARISNFSEHTSSSMKKVQKTEISQDLWTGMPQDLQFPSVPTDYNTPLSTPNLDNKHTPEMRFHPSSSNGSMYPMTPKSQHVSASWSQPGSSNFSSIGASSNYPVEVEADGNSLWWNHAATTPMAQPSPNTLHRNSQRATKSLAFHLQNELSYNNSEMNMAQGLMISMPESMPQQSFVVESSPLLHQGYFNASANGGGPQPHSPYHTHNHNAAPRTHSHSHYTHHTSSSSRKPHYSHPHPHPHPHSHSHSHPTSNSTINPNSSPTSSRPRKARTGSSGSESPSPKSSPTFHVRKQRKSKNRNTSPRTPTSGRGMVDFVNYTPDDSRRILTGVAPSGSSKTKARREKEAMEKRRKLSQAALKAIRAAGGDVGSLVEEGLFV
ncbi:hypothetical protein sscle_16g108030 [Sclerotinia sclerotiorum 1980 UF-70]|uniref:Developmental regulatory protein wetA n=1 Tax=Sclerotinia sclerotiorum (strain ATCC 18683 / 1980 / Ss-1) TaxID=665079 RepID=A0A1D9QN77_SCLS1|nr:hypothetical protein sscle_16g108030 [Sclerotinia sclerotiorum 1980 UF-70]